MRTMRLCLAAALFAAAGTLGLTDARAADEPEISFQRQLDVPLTLSLPGGPISEAFKQIAAAAKVPLQIDPACYELLPYGETTQVSATFNQSSLRDGLDDILIPLGLQESLSPTAVMIKPSGPLKRIGRRADWEELRLLYALYKSDDVKMASGGKFSLTDGIRAAMADTRKDLQVPVPGEANGSLSPAQERAVEQVGKQLPMSAYRALDLYCQLSGDVWTVEAGALAGGPTGGKVLIMTPKQWIVRQLDRPIKISRTNEPLEVVVADLTHASGIRFVPEPGLYQAVPAVNLQADNASVQQTLESLAGGTGIAYEVRDDSVLLYKAQAGAAAARNDTIVGRVSTPAGNGGTVIDWYIRESDLTPEQDAQRQKMIERAREELLKDGTAPASPAATATSTAPATTQAHE